MWNNGETLGGDITGLKTAIALTFWAVPAALSIVGTSWYNDKSDGWGVLVGPSLVVLASIAGHRFWKELEVQNERINGTVIANGILFLSVVWTPFVVDRNGWTWVCFAAGFSQCLVPSGSRLVRHCQVVFECVTDPPIANHDPVPDSESTVDQERADPSSLGAEDRQDLEEHALGDEDEDEDDDEEPDLVVFARDVISKMEPVRVMVPHLPSVATFLGDGFSIAVFWRILTPATALSSSARDVGIQMVSMLAGVILLNNVRFRRIPILQLVLSIGTRPVPTLVPVVPRDQATSNGRPLQRRLVDIHNSMTMSTRMFSVFVAGVVWGTSYGVLDQTVSGVSATNIDVIARTIAISTLLVFGMYSRHAAPDTFINTAATVTTIVASVVLVWLVTHIIPGSPADLLAATSIVATVIIAAVSTRLVVTVVSDMLLTIYHAYSNRRNADVFLVLFLGFVCGFVVVQACCVVISIPSISALILIEILSLTTIYAELTHN